MKKRIKKIRKGTSLVEKKIEKVIQLIAGPMAEVARGGVNNKRNVLGPANGLIRTYDKTFNVFEKIPNHSFQNDSVSVTEIKRMAGAVQSYKLKEEIENLFQIIEERNPNKLNQKISSIRKHITIIRDMNSIMRNEKIKLTA